MGKISVIILLLVFILAIGCIFNNSSQAQEIADKVIAHEESYKLYSTNGTVTILRTGTPRSYSFTLYVQRPDHYYLTGRTQMGISPIFSSQPDGTNMLFIRLSTRPSIFKKVLEPRQNMIRHNHHRRMTAGMIFWSW